MAEDIQDGNTGEVPEGTPGQLGPAANERFKWYIIHAYSGFERKVRESLESRVQAFGLQNKIGRVMIPTEPVTEIVNGKKRTVERVFLPGYVLVEMDLDNDLWHVIKNTPRVTGFLGTGDKPVALSEEEVSSIIFRSETSKDKPRVKIKFEKNESVRITEGPFANFNGDCRRSERRPGDREGYGHDIWTFDASRARVRQGGEGRAVSRFKQ